MTSIDLTAAIKAADYALRADNNAADNDSLDDSWGREAEVAVEAALPRILDQVPEYIPPTEPKPGTRWEYGVARDQVTPMSSRAAAEREIERQRKAPRGYRITSQRLVRRLVSDWEDVT